MQIKIEDNGFGISSKNLQHVFERYHRGDHQENKEIKVTDKDYITPEPWFSPTGEQSILKAKRAKEPRYWSTYPDELMSKTNINTKNMDTTIRILYAEDDADGAKLTKMILEKENFEVEIAPNGAKAWDAYKKQKPDILLVDLICPK